MDEEKPPSQNNLHSSTGSISPIASLHGRFKKHWSVCSLLAGVHFMGSIGYFGRPTVLGSIQGGEVRIKGI